MGWWPGCPGSGARLASSVATARVQRRPGVPSARCHHVSPQHLKRYLAEFDFRYNERAALGVSDEARGDRLIRGIVGKRLTYRD
jgi:hypothetical protein